MQSINWNGYEVRSDGSILNKDGSLKSLKTSPKGYLFTNFYFKGKLHTFQIHRVIWIAFNGVIPNGYEIDHINNVRDDNRLDNLQLLTKGENNQKSYDSGNRSGFMGIPCYK